MTNRSVNVYLLELGEQPGILSRIGGHLKRNWGKYALGAAALGTGAAIANPNLISSTGQAISGGLQKVAGGIAPAAQQVGQTAVQPGVLQNMRTSIAGGLNKTAGAVQTGANNLAASTWNLRNRIRPVTGM